MLGVLHAVSKLIAFTQHFASLALGFNKTLERAKEAQKKGQTTPKIGAIKA
tara:strand:- start:21 stop:173 length:153 start_codon:yes stop_codon:yes gene_type:complete